MSVEARVSAARTSTDLPAREDRTGGLEGTDLRLAVPAAGAWVATILLIGVPNAVVATAVVAWLSSAVAISIALVVRGGRWPGLTVVALVCTTVATGATAIAIHEPNRRPAALAQAERSSAFVIAIATATETARPSARSYRAELASAEFGSTTLTGRIPVVVLGGAPNATIEIGTTVELHGTIALTELGDDASALFFADGPPRVVTGPPWFLSWASALRSTFLQAAADLPGSGGDLLAGLAIGDTSAVTTQLDSAMKTSSLSHLTAVSGANCAIVVGLIMLAGAALGVPRAVRVSASVGVLIGFVVLVTPEPSVLRAAVMATLALLALSRGRPIAGIPILSLAVLILLVTDPWLARSYGFALSVLATAGLLVLAGPLSRLLGKWMPQWLAIVIAVPVAAQLACQPVIILLDASLPTYGVVANLLAAPAAPLATVVGLLACVTLAIVPPLGVGLCWLAWLPSAWIAGVAEFFAALPAARLPWLAGAPGAVLLVALSGAVVLLAVAAPRWQRRAAAVLVLALVVYLGVVGGNRISTMLTRPADWQLAACDIGQGDAMLVRSADRVALIDTGPDPALLKQCLDELGIARIDLLVLTHFDLDHAGGASALLGRVDVVMAGAGNAPSDSLLLRRFADGGATVRHGWRGSAGTLGELQWIVLWPMPAKGVPLARYAEGELNAPAVRGGFEIGNDSSLIVEFRPSTSCVGSCLSSLFLGDLGRESQEALMRANALRPVDVVKVSHHGSADQSARLYAQLSGTVGLIGVGLGNGYGHPTSELLAMLRDAGTLPARTDSGGMVLLEPGPAPGSVTVWTER